MSRQRTFNISSGKDATGKWLKPTAYCPHCGNDGMVQLDESVDHAPCPMCVQGGMVEERVMGAPGLFLEPAPPHMPHTATTLPRQSR